MKIDLETTPKYDPLTCVDIEDDCYKNEMRRKIISKIVEKVKDKIDAAKINEDPVETKKSEIVYIKDFVTDKYINEANEAEFLKIRETG